MAQVFRRRLTCKAKLPRDRYNKKAKTLILRKLCKLNSKAKKKKLPQSLVAASQHGILILYPVVLQVRLQCISLGLS